MSKNDKKIYILCSKQVSFCSSIEYYEIFLILNFYITEQNSSIKGVLTVLNVHFLPCPVLGTIRELLLSFKKIRSTVQKIFDNISRYWHSKIGIGQICTLKLRTCSTKIRKNLENLKSFSGKIRNLLIRQICRSFQGGFL